MGNLGFLEIGTILVLMLLVFGPDRLPEVARNAAKLLARFRAETSRSIEELKRAANVDGLDGELKEIRDEFGRIRSEVKGLGSDFSRSFDGPGKGGATRGKVRSAPAFDPDAT